MNVTEHTISATDQRTAQATGESLRRQPTQRRAQERIRLILDAADRLLASGGSQALGTKQVADAAGISIGSLYHWFPDKESIALALAKRHWQQLGELVAGVADGAEKGLLNDPMSKALNALAAGFRSRPGFTALWYSELRTGALRDATRPNRALVAGAVARILSVEHPDSGPGERETVARMVTLLGDGIMREAFRLDRKGDPALLDEGRQAIRAYIAARLSGSGA